VATGARTAVARTWDPAAGRIFVVWWEQARIAVRRCAGEGRPTMSEYERRDPVIVADRATG
jgi:hypothetical protein